MQSVAVFKLISTTSGHGPVADSCERDIEQFPRKYGQILNQLSEYNLLMKHSALSCYSLYRFVKWKTGKENKPGITREYYEIPYSLQLT
jgi:hypothetical protein